MKSEYLITDGDRTIKGSTETISHYWNLITGFAIPSNEQEQEIADLTNFDLLPNQF